MTYCSDCRHTQFRPTIDGLVCARMPVFPMPIPKRRTCSRGGYRPLETYEVCPQCEGGGWECYGTGFNDPHFKECDFCNNPEGLASP